MGFLEWETQKIPLDSNLKELFDFDHRKIKKIDRYKMSVLKRPRAKFGSTTVPLRFETKIKLYFIQILSNLFRILRDPSFTKLFIKLN